MKTKAGIAKAVMHKAMLLPLMWLTILGATASAAEETDSGRSHAVVEGQGIARGTLGSGDVDWKEYAALQRSGSRQKNVASATQQKAGSGAVSSVDVDFWFYDVDLQLFADNDRDGYFYGIDLLFDADTVYASAEVYAVIYLSYEGGPWNEYADTANFNIYGASSDDEYIVQSELVSGYPTGHYDVLIDLYDTYDNSLVASIGPDETSQLSFLPLEDIARDTPDNTRIVVSSGGGGAFGWLQLLLLAVLAGRAFRARRLA